METYPYPVKECQRYINLNSGRFFVQQPPKRGKIERIISIGQLRWLGSLVVRASDLRLNGREFDPRPPHCRSVGTGISDRPRASIPPRRVTSHRANSASYPVLDGKLVPAKVRYAVHAAGE